MTKEQLGKEIRRARKARGISQEEVRLALDVNIRQVGRWEKGENVPSSLALMRLISFFRKRADLPDLQTLILAVEQQEISDLESRLNEIRQRIRTEPWLLERIDRLLDLTDKEWEATKRRLDQGNDPSADQSNP